MDKTAKNNQIKPLEVREGFLYFTKNGIINIKKAPAYGEVTFFYKNGKLSHTDTRSTDKHE